MSAKRTLAAAGRNGQPAAMRRQWWGRVPRSEPAPCRRLPREWSASSIPGRTTAEWGRTRIDGRPHAPDDRAGGVAQCGAVRSQDPSGKALPVALGRWQKEMPDARGRSRRWWPIRGTQRKLPAWALYKAKSGKKQQLQNLVREARAVIRTLRDQR
jgi:hypothetical protein